jgi:tRNA U55 pseudouridine synthase TruB
VYETVIDFSKMSDTWDLGYRENYEEYPLSLPSFGLSPCKGDPAVLRGRVKGGRGDFEQVKGIIVNHTEIPAPTREAIEAKFKSLLPSHELPLPAFSAKKKDGKRLYQLARSGKEISESRVMKVHSFEILEYAFPRLRVRLAVGSGTYIRSIGYWLGQEFGLGGILTELRRISLGEWSLEKLVLPEEVEYHMRGQIGVMKWRVISN